MTDDRDAWQFACAEGRFPCLGDEVAPWRRRGWLLLYVVEAHRVMPELGDRWGYWMEAREAGCLPDRPIPRMRFASGCREAQKQIAQALQQAEAHGAWSAWGELVRFLAWGLLVGKDEPRLEDAAQEGLYRELNLEPLLRQPGDHLGQFLVEQRGGGWNPNAFFPTPHDLCEMMTLMVMGEEGDGDCRGATVCDPCVGTGRFLLHASNRSLRLYGVDIDPMLVSICLINGALYAPWLAFPLPDAVFGGRPAPPLVVPPGGMATTERGQGLLFG